MQQYRSRLSTWTRNKAILAILPKRIWIFLQFGFIVIVCISQIFSRPHFISPIYKAVSFGYPSLEAVLLKQSLLGQWSLLWAKKILNKLVLLRRQNFIRYCSEIFVSDIKFSLAREKIKCDFFIPIIIIVYLTSITIIYAILLAASYKICLFETNLWKCNESISNFNCNL